MVGDSSEVDQLLQVIFYIIVAIFLILPTIELFLWIRRKYRGDD